MGFGIGTYRGRRTLRTSGGDVGTATGLVFYPDQKAVIAVLCNMDSVVMGGQATVDVDVLTNGLADIFLEADLEPRAAPTAGPTRGDSALPPAVKLSADDLVGKSGFYRVGSSDDHIVSMSVRNGRFMLRDFYGDNYDIPMTPLSSNRFAIPNTTLEFSTAGAGRPQAWHVIDGEGRRLLELPLVKFDVSRADLPAFTGEYRSAELDVTYAVAIRDSSLVVQTSTLYPVAQDTFVGDYMGTVRFVRDARGSVTTFTLNRAGARGVLFQRVKPAD
jgi:hypothetical protein